MFLMLVVSRNRFNLKNEISTKIDEKFNDFKIVIIAEIREQIKQQGGEALEKKIKKTEQLKVTVCTFQKHVKNYQKQVNELKDS